MRYILLLFQHALTACGTKASGTGNRDGILVLLVKTTAERKNMRYTPLLFQHALTARRPPNPEPRHTQVNQSRKTQFTLTHYNPYTTATTCTTTVLWLYKSHGSKISNPAPGIVVPQSDIDMFATFNSL